MTVDLSSSPLWTHLFAATGYVSALACVYAAVVLGRQMNAKSPRLMIARELAIFAFFAVMLFLLESFAHFRTPYYAYSPTFLDEIPRAHFFENQSFWKHGAVDDASTKIVTELHQKLGYGIPLSVVLLEASLTYAGFRASRIVHPNVIAQPFLAGLCVMIVDALLDPVVATSRVCSPAAKHVEDCPVVWTGVGLWHWFVLPDGPKGLGQFLHIPLFNFAAWLGGPTALVALACAIGSVVSSGAPGRAKIGTVRAVAYGFGVVTFAVIYLVVLVAPNLQPNPLWQWVAMLFMLAVAIASFFAEYGSFSCSNEETPMLARPAALSILLGNAIILCQGGYVTHPCLLPLSAVVTTAALWLAWLPHHDQARNFVVNLSRWDGLVRIHYFGFTSMLIVLGAATTNLAPDPWVLAALIGVGACFHVYSYLQNDLLHPEKDRSSMTNVIAPETALGIVAAVVPAAFFVLIHLQIAEGTDFVHRGAGALWSGIALCGILGAAFGLMTLYNYFGEPKLGKDWKVAYPPMLTDLAQGSAWGLLALLGALVTPHPQIRELKFDLVRGTLALAVYGTCFALLASGIHGGLRNVAADRAASRATTVIVLGGPPGPDGRVKWRRVQLYAHGVHIFMFAAAVYFVLYDKEQYPDYVWAILLGLVATFAASAWLLARVVREDEQDATRSKFISFHLFWLMLPPLVVAIPATRLASSFRWAVPVAVLLPLLFQGDVLKFILNHAYRSDGERLSDSNRYTPQPFSATKVKGGARAAEPSQEAALPRQAETEIPLAESTSGTGAASDTLRAKGSG